MDDFGSAYSSLNALRMFDFNEIKLDMAFMEGFDEKAREVVSAIVAMAKELGMHTLAEGVETRSQVSFLRSIGCEHIQGYYYGRLACPLDGAVAYSTRTESGPPSP